MQPSDLRQSVMGPQSPDGPVFSPPQSRPPTPPPFPVQPPSPVQPASQPPALAPTGSDMPVPVVKVLSVRGVEYAMMTIALWVVASTLAWIILNALNGSGGFGYLVVPSSALIVCLPIFGWLFLRLKRGEIADPSLRFDPSKRRWSQMTQILAYLACLINTIYFVYSLLQHTAGKSGPSIGKAAINLVVILVIAGGVLAYYWADEHRLRKV